MEDVAVEDTEDFSMEDPVCIDGVIFYGPMTDREKMVKEKFERRQIEKVKTQFLPTLSNKEFTGNITKTSEESKNDLNDISIYESFSLDESKYESFNDSLDERKFLNPNELNVSKLSPEQTNVNKRKFQSKQILKGSLCDSLEDIHSLISNVEKLSISEEIEKINILEKNHVYDDSLKNDVCLESKNFNSIDQNFDDDSLAILDFEKAFDDSLEEADILSLSHMDNVLIVRNGENTEISVENIAKESAVTKNLFETSVEVIYENAGYVEDSEEGNAEAPKLPSLTADSLSISENMSKDSLDGLPVIPKYLEQKTYKRSLCALNRDDFETSVNSLKMEYCSNAAVANDINSKPIFKQNLPQGHHIKRNEQDTNIKRNASRSNNTIVVEDALIKSPDATPSNKNENSVNSLAKDFSPQINDSDKVSSYLAESSNSPMNNRKISTERINKADIHPNDTICIDDSIILPQTTLINGDLLYDGTQVSLNQKVNVENNSAENLNDSVDAHNSVQATLNIKSEKRTPKEKISKKSINSKFCIQNPIKDTSENFDTGVHPNDTICIDDSFNLPQNTSMKKDEFNSLETEPSGNRKSSDLMLSCENNATSNSKLNDSLNNSFTICPQHLLESESSLSSLKRKKDKSFQGKVSKSHILSPVKHQVRQLEKNNEAKTPNVNETIYIDDSPVALPSIKKEKKSPSSEHGSKMSGKKSKNKPIDSRSHIQSPVKYELHHLEKKNEATVCNLNNTIFIENSPSESSRIKMDKRSPFADKSSKDLSPEFKSHDAANKKQLTSLQIAKVFDSPQVESPKSSISENIVKNSKNVFDYFKDALVLPKDLPKDSNLKLQLEVVFDENQGVNIVSVSTVDECTGNNTPSVLVDSRKIAVGKVNRSPNLNDENKDLEARKLNRKISESSVKSDKIISKGCCSSELLEIKPFVTKGHPVKSKAESTFTNDIQKDSSGHDLQLLEALDLHDTSCSFIDNGFLQSRDSIMPLNLCIRSRSPENNYQYFTKVESKENIPFLDKQLATPEGCSKNKKKSSTKTSNETPKQLNYNTDVKKSGSKTNSITKIPVRKIDNFCTPVHQKSSKDNKNGSAEKFFKNPLVKSASVTDNLTSSKPLETPRKHHFCSVRNSISRVPKSAPRSIPKKFQNIESPIAKYIGKPQIYTPLKTTHRYDGNLILGNTVKTSKHAIKTPNSACKGSPQCSAGKL